MNEDQKYWREVLWAMDDLMIDWQCRPCKCGLGMIYEAEGYVCKRCKIVNLCSQFKATLETEQCL